MPRHTPPRWVSTTIGEQFTLQRGFDITRAAQTSGPVPVVSSGGVSSWHNVPSAQAPGVVIGRKGTLGRVYFLDVDYWPHDTTLWVKDFKSNIPRFVYYFLVGADFGHLDVGTANPTLNRNHVHPIRVVWPPIDEQRRIAELLGTLDDLIDTNDRQISHIRALNGELYRRALAQDEPQLRSFLDVFEVEFGGAFKGEFFTEAGVGMPLLRIRDLKTASPKTWTTERLPNEVLVSAGDILFGMDAEFRASQWVGPPALLNQRVCRVRARDGSNAFAVEALKAPLAYIEGHKTGTTVIHLNKRDLQETTVLVPSRTAVAEFDSLAEPLRLWSVSLSAESELLRRTRDELLPLLMSGAVRVRSEGVAA